MACLFLMYVILKHDILSRAFIITADMIIIVVISIIIVFATFWTTTTFVFMTVQNNLQFASATPTTIISITVLIEKWLCLLSFEQLLVLVITTLLLLALLLLIMLVTKSCTTTSAVTWIRIISPLARTEILDPFSAIVAIYALSALIVEHFNESVHFFRALTKLFHRKLFGW